MLLGEYIKEYRASHGDMSQDAFAKLSGISKGYISMLENNKNPRTKLPISPTIDMYKKVANVAGISLNELFSVVDSPVDLSDSILPLPANKAYPLVGNIACGTPILAEENITEYIQYPGDIAADFCLRCRGDSMIDARIHDGDIVFIRQQPEVANGEIAAVQIGEDATLKRVYRSEDGSTLTLMAANPTYPPMVYSGEQLASVRILGKAVNFLSTVK